MQEHNNNQNDTTNLPNPRSRKRTFRVRRGTFHSEQYPTINKGQSSQGNQLVEHMLFHKLGTLEPVLLSIPGAEHLLRGRGSPRAIQRDLACPSPEVLEDGFDSTGCA